MNRQPSFPVNPLQQPPAPGTSDSVVPAQYQQLAPDHIIQAAPVFYSQDPVSSETTAPSSTVYHHVSMLNTHNGDSSDEDVCR